MRIDYDYVREILLTLEKNINWSFDDYGKAKFISENPLRLKDQLCNLLPNITIEELAYTSIRLSEAGYINIKVHYAISEETISDIEYFGITYNGHQYLDSVRNSKVWKAIKSNTVQLTFDIIKAAALAYAKSQFKF